MALGYSVLLHAVVIGLFMTLGSSSAPSGTAEDGEEEEVEVEDTTASKKETADSDESAKPPTGTKVEPVKASVTPVKPPKAVVDKPTVKAPDKPVAKPADKPTPPPAKVDSVVAKPTAKVAPVKDVSPEDEDGAQEMPRYHVVKQGETLTKIAAMYNTTPQKLAKLNGKSLSAMNKLWVAQKVKLRK